MLTLGAMCFRVFSYFITFGIVTLILSYWKTCSHTTLQLCFLTHVCSGMYRCIILHREITPLSSKLVSNPTLCMAVLGSGWKCYISYILHTEQSRVGKTVALSPVVPKHMLAVICLSWCCMFRLQNHKFE